MPIIEFECPHDDCVADAKLNLLSIEVIDPVKRRLLVDLVGGQSGLNIECLRSTG